MSTIDISKFRAFVNSMEGSIGILPGGFIRDGSEIGNECQLPDLEKYIAETTAEIDLRSMKN